MRKLLILIIFIICFSVISCASDNAAGAIKFMTKFLAGEYSGDQSLRVDNAMYSPERKLWVEKRYYGMIGEIPQWDGDPLCVVDSYEIKKITITNQTAIIDVEFQEFARTDGEKGVVDGSLIKTEKKNVQRYYLEYKDGRWWIYDPPIP